MSSTTDLQEAIGHCITLLREGRPTVAESQARAILEVHPNEINALRALAESLRMQGHPQEALKILTPLIERAGDFNLAHLTLGRSLFDISRLDDAVRHLQIATNLDPKLGEAWQVLGECYTQLGDDAAARSAFNHHLASSNANPIIQRIISHIDNNEIGKAERLCRDFLLANPTDVTVIRLLADIAMQLKQYDDAAVLLERCIELAPDFELARFNFAQALSSKQQPEAALEQLNLLDKQADDNPRVLALKAAIVAQMGNYDEAIELYEIVMQAPYTSARTMMSFGHALKTTGDQARAIEHYRMAIDKEPTLGEAFWSLANLKTYKLSDQDIEALRQIVHGKHAERDDFIHACFSLGKAFADRNNTRLAFRYYQEGNRVKAKAMGFSTERLLSETHRIKTTCTPKLYQGTATKACQAPDPIFIVGLPRSGSTLLEQILSSHSLVDGTKELPDIIALARQIAGKPKKGEQSNYPEGIAKLSDEQAKALGEEYLKRTSIQRGDAPFFIDKMPNNFMHIGLIKRILPNAKIIDARRDAMDACFSGYKQLFASGQRFTYSLDYISRYYIEYVKLMDHWDGVFPNQILRVQYENVVSDFEHQVKRILDYCGLDFEPECLEFYNTKRAVRTASSEQVRQPIYTQGMQQWLPYAPFLQPMAARFNRELNTSYALEDTQPTA